MKSLTKTIGQKHYYTNALKLGIENNAEKGVCYKNRAAAYLKLGNYEEVIKDCNSALNICCNKTLYSRCQALEGLKRFDEAYRDAEIIVSSDPNNEVIQSVKERLHEIVQGRREDPNLSATISQLLDLVFNESEDKENRETAMIKLYTFARDEAGAEEIFQKEGVSKIAQLVKVEENEKLICNAIYIVRELCKNSIGRTDYVMKYVGLFWCLEMMNSASTERVNASQSCLQTILNIYSGMNNKCRPKPDMRLCLKYKSEIYMILSCLLNSVTSRTITGLARDAIIEFITRNMHYAALNWAEQLVDFGGLQKLMEVATQLEEHESSLDITSSTRTLISISLAKIHKSIDCNDDKTTFTNAIYEFIQDKLLKSDTESKVRGVVAIITLIFGPFKVADEIIFKEGMVEKIFAMAETDDVLEQKVICECVIAAATKYNKFNEFIDKGVNILQKLDKSNNDIIRILAFLGLCKLSKFKRNYVIQPFAGKATHELVKVCRRLLVNPKKEKDMIKWAIKGLSYITFDGDIKDELIGDQQIFQTIIELAKISDQSVLYSVVTTLGNLCNAYDKQGFTFIPEMEELEKHVKQYFHKEYLAKDYENFVQERRRLLVNNGVTSALVSLAKTGNQNCKELTARVFSAICGKEELTETVVQQGGTKALLSLALDGTDKGKKIASQVLVHMTLTLPPEIAFPGDLMMDVVQPITNLLNPKRSVNERCEALTALCNLASVDNSMRLHIFNDSGFENFNNYMSDNHNMLDCAYAKLINNLVLSREVAIQYVEQRSYQLKDLMTWFVVGSEDERTKKAAVEAVATLTTASKEACEKLLSWDLWRTFLHLLLNNLDSNLQHKGIEIALNMMESTKDVATKLMKTADIMEPLRELSKNDTMQNKEIKELASLVLEAAAKWDKIEGNVEGNESSDSIDNIKHVV
ncbi:protein unc-45 homolog B-like [Temnothorax nylanderi]|uniref:protein unc-45 homolog B-like n=1 Tax=Temnothorax nylanderi TaxID=102681 RepID=UPI003A84CA6D